MAEDSFGDLVGNTRGRSHRRDVGRYVGTLGYFEKASPEGIRKRGHVLTPCRYVGVATQENDKGSFERKMSPASRPNAGTSRTRRSRRTWGIWREQVRLLNSLFVTRLQGDGSHWAMTMPVYAGRFLADIEQLFGPRDPSFTMLGFEIDATPGARPHLWYPDSGIASDDPARRSRHIVIRLTSNALIDPARARWQLAHECFHLLDPWNERVDGRPATWLEEGLAAWFQNSRVPEAEHHEGLYALAENLVTCLMDELPNAVELIRRERRLRISEITPDVLRKYCPRFNDEMLLKLCRPFQ